MLAFHGGALAACYATDDDDVPPVCFSIDVATGKTTPAKPPAPLGRAWPRVAPSLPPVKLKNTGGGKRPQVCRADGSKCKTLAMSRAIDQGMGLVHAVNASTTIAALATLDWIDTFDLKSGRRLATFGTGPLKSSCNALKFAGDTLVVGEESDCGSEGMTAWLATKAGKKLADVGGNAPLLLGYHSIAPAGGNHYAFASQAGDTVAIHDIKTGALVKRLSVPGAAPKPSTTLLSDGTTLALVYNGARLGALTFVDVTTETLTQLVLPRCAK